MAGAFSSAFSSAYDVFAIEPPSAGGGSFGYSRKPTKVYRPFDRDIEAIQAVLDNASPKRIEEPVKAKPRRKRELIRKVTQEAVRILEGEGLIANAPVRQELSQAAYEVVRPVFETRPVDSGIMAALIETMLQRAADESFRQQMLEYEAIMAFEADEEDVICLLLAA